MSKTYSNLTVMAPQGWTLKHDRKWVGPQHQDYADDLDQPAFKRKGVFARQCVNFESVHEIELRSHYNGSGPLAFGGAKQWPVIDSKVAFNEDEYTLAVEFAKDLGKFIDEWMKERNR